jgi:predicted oxidoreductase
MKAQLTFTYGGLKCDLDSRVLATTGVPIPGTCHVVVSIRVMEMIAVADSYVGLYAAGELSGLFYNEVSRQRCPTLGSTVLTIEQCKYSSSATNASCVETRQMRLDGCPLASLPHCSCSLQTNI